MEPVHPKGNQSWIFIGSDNHFAFLNFFFFGMVLVTAFCKMLWIFFHSSSGTLSNLTPWTNLLLHCIIMRGLISFITEWPNHFPYFLQLKPEFCNKEFMIWATVSSWACFCWLYRASSSLTAKNIVSLILVLTIWWCPHVESSLVLLEEVVCYDQYIFVKRI